MPDAADQTLIGDEHSALPRFLSRDETDRGSIVPPPLPRDAWLVRVRRLTGATPRRAATVFIAVCVLVPATAAFVTGGGRGKVETPPLVSAVSYRDEVGEASPSDAVFEARLGYAGNLATIHLDMAALDQSGPSAGEQQASAEPPPTQPSETGDSIAFELPAYLTSSPREPVGEEAWAVAARDPDQVVVILRDGVENAPSADAEMFLGPGVTLGWLDQAVRKDIEAAATPSVVAPGATEPQATASVVETDEAEAKPSARPRHAHHRSHSKVARADRGLKSRAGDQWDAKVIDANATEAQKQSGDSVAKDETGEKKPGVLTKFFAWLKSGAAKSSGGDEPGTRMGLSPQP
jgi:hypothetical protein